MKKNTLISFIAILAILTSSCEKKEEAINQNPSNNKMATMDEIHPIEAKILKFINRMDMVRENPDYSGSENWNYTPDSMVWYIEAALNYAYVRLDYEYCAEVEEYQGSQEFNTSEDQYNIVDVQDMYDAILDDWRDKYYSVEDETRTPMTFDIASFDENAISYRMVVTHGYVELEDYSFPITLASPPIHWIFAGTGMSYTMEKYISYLNSLPITDNCFFVSVGNYRYGGPPFPLNPNDPNPGDQYIDHIFFYSYKGSYHFHTYLDQAEYSYHEQAYFDFVDNFRDSIPGNGQVSFSYMACDEYFPPGGQYADEIWHEPFIAYGIRIPSCHNTSTL